MAWRPSKTAREEARRRERVRSGQASRTRRSLAAPAGEDHAAGRVVLVCALWALLHSALASKRAKDLAGKAFGRRYRDGLYRVLYNAQSVVSVGLAARWFLRLPDRELYRAGSPLSLLMRAGQMASLGVLLSGVRVVGVLDFAGLARLWNLLIGVDRGPEPEAQGPPLGAGGEMAQRGAFRLNRHPGNAGALGFFMLWPRMTVNRAVLAALVALYAVLGSMHEEYRLREAYGEAYERYRLAVPFMLPRPRR